MQGALIARPPVGAPIRDLERLWLKTACAYEQFDETLMDDHDWDSFARELNDRRSEWSPYFSWSIPGHREGDFNVGSTASGVDWRANTAARPVYETLARDYGCDPLGLLPLPPQNHQK